MRESLVIPVVEDRIDDLWLDHLGHVGHGDNVAPTAQRGFACETGGMGRRRHKRPAHTPLSIQGATHWKADGSAKRRFATEREAADGAQLQWVEHGIELNVYRCDFCQGWHMGRPPRDSR